MPERAAHDRQPPLALTIGGLLAVATATFVVASLLHFGVRVAVGPVELADPFAGAAIPEAIIAVLAVTAGLLLLPATRRDLA